MLGREVWEPSASARSALPCPPRLGPWGKRHSDEQPGVALLTEPRRARELTPGVRWTRWWLYEHDLDVEPLYRKLCDTGSLSKDDHRERVAALSDSQLVALLASQHPSWPEDEIPSRVHVSVAKYHMIEMAIRRRAAEDGYELRGMHPDPGVWLALVGPGECHYLPDEPTLSDQTLDQLYRRMLRDGAGILRGRPSPCVLEWLFVKLRDRVENDGLRFQTRSANDDEYV
jgi:hypothetical protein